jgi:DNA-binding LacI/PurR family transcriptional regulator
VELLTAARSAGVRILEDLAVATISEMGMAESTQPALMTLGVNQDLLGALAGELLVDAMEGLPVASITDLPTRLSSAVGATRPTSRVDHRFPREPGVRAHRDRP